MMNMLVFVLCLVTSCTGHGVHGIPSINKPHVKSIQKELAYEVDCIDVNKQPAFDHPLLKNHKLQRKTSFQKTVKNSPAEPIFGLEKIRCPKGTVPIRRTTKDDLIQPKWFSKTQCQTPDIQVAEMSLKTSLNPPYYGVSGTTSIYNPRVKSDQSSSAEIWVQNGEPGGINKIVFGWHVYPGLYGDDKTHIYSAWTSDNFMKTGCYNTLCPGFVQIDKGYMVGGLVQDTSVYGGAMVEMNVSILQDPITYNWWVIMQDRSVGYFPASLFSNMTSADHVGWGGRTTTPPHTPSPPMGSGYLPDANLVHACYFRKISYQDETGQNKAPITYLMETFLTDANPSCSDVRYYGYHGLEYGFNLEDLGVLIVGVLTVAFNWYSELVMTIILVYYKIHKYCFLFCGI